MTRDSLYDETIRIVDTIDRVKYPDTIHLLEGVLDSGELMNVDVCSLTAALKKCDKPDPLPGCITDYMVELYEIGIAEGNPDAMNDLGAMYYCGTRGFEQNYGKAVYYYEMAMENGSRQARENLGYCYYYGRTGEPDYEKAFYCFAPGAFEGRLVSLYKIGDMYLNGYYVQKDEREAFALYSRCLEISDIDDVMVDGPVHLRLGDLYLKGAGTDWDPEQAMYHYNLAEILLYRMVKDGDTMYMQSLRNAVEGQRQARMLLKDRLPD